MERTKKKIDMDYEKKYKEALERFKTFREKYCTYGELHFGDVIFDKTGEAQKDLDAIFPELRESEDEKIRKEIIEFIQWSEDRGMTRHDFHQAKRPSEWITYLEKQKDQKHLSTEETELNSIAFLEQMGYTCIPQGAKPAEWSEEDENNLELVIDCIYKFYPDPVMKYKLKEWLKSLRPVKQEWSEEDETMLRTIISDGSRGVELDSKQISWLKSLRPVKQEWSEEDEKNRRNLMSLLANMRGDRITEETYQKYYPWLKSLRSRPKPSDNWKPSGEQPQVADASKMEPEGIDAVVSHREGVHYIAANTEQLNARLKQFDEGAKVLVYIEARKED